MSGPWGGRGQQLQTALAPAMRAAGSPRTAQPAGPHLPRRLPGSQMGLELEKKGAFGGQQMEELTAGAGRPTGSNPARWPPRPPGSSPGPAPAPGPASPQPCWPLLATLLPACRGVSLATLMH